MYTITTSNVTIMVKNMMKAIDFYLGLGLTLKQRWEDYYAILVAPGISIGLHPAEKTNERSNDISLGFGVEKINEVEKRLKELGVQYQRSDDQIGIYAHFHDPDGTPIYFMESKVGEW
jgi:catechol 2,3-dioxygenase-like lactoylglutathione lyase family enzyme